MADSPAATNGTDKPKKITFRFCQECSNMLYPHEETSTNKLLFQCRSCHWKEDAPISVIYRNEMSNTVGETAGITQDVAQDPTVGGSRGSHTSSSSPSNPVPNDSVQGARLLSPTSMSADPSSDFPPLSPLLRALPLDTPDFCTMCGQEIFCVTCGEEVETGCFLETEETEADSVRTLAAMSGERTIGYDCLPDALRSSNLDTERMEDS
ncbi:hypothetical protein P152DRAFT_462196 [Eremomyces bilateralis CBS 781.70]|uniref:DNA-directed RNA polymerase II subunit RPB9-like zinc ribbon domain-containing protein n=1 Tax=Eremomyces bilateralis CBS 781.70 TaxID=1392243 RepID=A0A6G1FSV6_9PEZI|nr:uncharacterized protein P152DRAFT_462196 [Eremomyces bilateralis CBS 781.70]KAF1808798.1 hypothetical protein P152DRAFT_462196 [Eremomyces bilateralis CBS 781.70]